MSPRSSQRVDRRRRVLVDESRNDEPLIRPRIFRGDDEGPLARYSEAALRSLNAPIARYIPFRTFCLVIWFLIGLIPILGLMLLDQRRYQIAEWLGADALRIFNLTEAGSLASWCASFAFAAAALVILAIYSVRRHRRDDYRARFAMWQWVLVVTLFACIDTAVGIHGLVQFGCDRLFGPLAWGEGSAWWVGVWGTLILATTIRLAFEMSSSRCSIGWMVGGVICYLWCGLVQLGTVGLNDAAWAQSSQAPLILLGHHFTLFALVTYARDVVREAMGIVEEVRTASNSEAAPSKNNAKATAMATPSKKAKSPKLRAVTADGTPGDPLSNGVEAMVANVQPPMMKVVGEDGEDDADMTKLSRADRRRIRKQQRRNKAA